MGRGGALGSGSGGSGWLRRGGGVGSVSAGGGCAERWGSRSAAVCVTRPVRRFQPVLGGLACTAWYLGGGGVPRPPLLRHVGVRWRQRLVVRVD